VVCLKYPIMKIGLGTVQFGLDYGVSNPQGITPATEVKEILALAWESGITILDTAAVYGMSEEVIGQSTPEGISFKIVSKTPLFKKDRIDKADATRLKETFLQSIKRVKQTTIYGLLAHHAHDLLVPGGYYLWQTMEDLKAAGLVKKIGASVYSPYEIEELLGKYRLDLIQLSVNVFDQRMIQGGYLRRLKNLGIEIHSRSVFLQGLLLMTPENLPPYFNPIRPIVMKYRSAIQKRSINPLAASLWFVYQQPEIDYIIVGVNNHSHLEAIINVIHNIETLSNFDFSEYAVTEESIINPSLWRLQ
jgi:aryl-alcohol dehydrogenase-like predicted oxidoreductase